MDADAAQRVWEQSGVKPSDDIPSIEVGAGKGLAAECSRWALPLGLHPLFIFAAAEPCRTIRQATWKHCHGK